MEKERPLSRLRKSDFFKPFLSFIMFFTASTILDPQHFFTIYDQQVLAQQASIYTILGMGEMIVILMGSIDLSAAGIYGLAIMVAGYIYAYVTPSLILAILIAIVTGALFGMFNGLIVAKGKIFSFVATLATSLIAYGAMLFLTGGKSIYPLPAFSIFGRLVAGIPFSFLLALLITLLLYFLLKFTAFGRYIYAIGGNEDAAYYSGVNISMIKILAFTIAGITYSIAGIITVGLLQSATPEASAIGNLLLYAIAAAVLGGIELTGGVGSPIGPLIGGYILVMISNILVLLNVNVYTQYMVTGILVILVTISISRGKRWVK